MSEADEEVALVKRGLTEAIHDAFSANDEYVIKWVTSVEVMQSNGQRAIWVLMHEETSEWDAVGMLEYARQQLQSAHVLSMLAAAHAEDDDDD